ncbi:MAG: cytidylate kinase family protein [Spirochaetia bacterium]|jgi:cytidylate kinase|nr:cytidylate kinase family protein [Spirochaetia bacterium]
MSGAEQKNKMPRASIIAISGKSGCGNTTVSRLVAERLGRTFINYTFRKLAEEEGMSLAELLALAKEDPSWDRLLDSRQVALAHREDCVIGSRLAMWLLGDADLRVYLRAGQSVRVGRIFAREGGDREAIARFTAARDKDDQRRYREIYGIDTEDLSSAHLVIDTERWDAPSTADIIVRAFATRQKVLRDTAEEH